MLERIHLSIVQEVDKQGSLTAAAEVLHLTQSALSHSIRKLEQQLGTEVWQREGRSLRLTQAGQYLLAVANRVLPQLALAEERLGQFAQGERGSLRIGMECHPCYQWLLKVVSNPIWRRGPRWMSTSSSVSSSAASKRAAGLRDRLARHARSAVQAGAALRARVRLRAGAGGGTAVIGWRGAALRAAPRDLSRMRS